jgi:hypothetical protein
MVNDALFGSTPQSAAVTYDTVPVITAGAVTGA